ncbi:unnamed protein product [Acanthoscelides obtectus]|nr:unnamed protein product [Acanthoscelides obtectus]CAK1628950.1 RNA-binding protein 5 [Acanthoscelides obtectus]
MLQDHYRAIMQYSIPKEGLSAEKPANYKVAADWFCIKCGAQNFKRRDNCFKCHASRTESEEGGSGSDEVCTYPTKTIMLRNLDALTTEDSVMAALNTAIPEWVKSISAVCVGRDPLTSTSRGLCYIGTECTIDALGIFGALSSLKSALAIDGKTVTMSYCKYYMGDTKKQYSQADHEAFPNAAVPSTYQMSDVDNLAEYSARRYAKTPQEYLNYLDYYRTYFSQQISSGNSITLHQDNQMDSANAAAAVAQSAIQQVNANKNCYETPAVPSGTDGKKYPIPDISKYSYDKASGFQYDPSTGLYYDPNSCYYWNSIIQQYLYWDNERMTYVLAPTTRGNQAACSSNEQEPAAKKQKSEKQDKVKVAKKIAKDMERWAKTLNQKKEMSSSKVSSDMNCTMSSAAADIGFSVLEKKSMAAATMPVFKQEYQAPLAQATATATGPLVAAYGGESDSSGDDEDDLLDFNTLICNLCMRQLGNAEALQKHARKSSLHKQNLEARRIRKGEAAAEKIVYRDRAKERRMKYGDPDEPQPSKLKEKYLKAREADLPVVAASVSEPIGAENVGNRLLQKMGWSEGQGLGKQNQGRTTIIQAEQHSSTVGLGNKMAGYTAIAGESYKECVKKMMYARYQELTERENSN